MDKQRLMENKQGLIKHLNDFLGDGERALTPGNFGQFRPIVDALFPATQALGVDIGNLRTDYQMELIQSSGGPNNPSAGRLHYIKGRLQDLLARVEAYNP